MPAYLMSHLAVYELYRAATIRAMEWEALGDPCTRANRETEVTLECFRPLTASTYEIVLFISSAAFILLALGLTGWAYLQPTSEKPV